MARFEMTLATGEKILVNHSAGDMSELLATLDGSAFVLLNEVKGGSSTPARDVIVASRQITLVRALGDGATQSSTFQGKR